MKPNLCLPFTLVLIALFMTACGDSPTTSVAMAQAPAKVATLPEFFYVTANLEDRLNLETSVEQVSSAEPHAAVLRLSGVRPGAPLEVQFRLKDPSGADYPLKDALVKTNPNTNVWNVWFTFMEPATKTIKPGRWTWSAEINGKKTLAKEVTLLPATPEELEFKTLYQQATEQAFIAFAHYWVAVDDYFVVEPGGQVELVQVTGLEYKLSKEPIGEADRLNGVQFRGELRFGCELSRSYTQGEGWSDWKGGADATARLLEGPTMQGVGFMGPSYFSLHKRDGNWFVYAGKQGQDKFVNGKCVRGNQRPYPHPERVRELVKNGRNLERDKIKAEADPIRGRTSDLGPTGADTIKALNAIWPSLF